MSTVISVENVSKQYRLGEVGTGSIAHDLNRWWHKVRGKGDPYLMVGETNDRSVKGNSEYAWALQDVSFDVKQGEVLGIIGRNGAGKSTILKILSRVTQPTTGHIKVKGRMASLLEVGTGFHPELTGKENIFLNGAILGMRREEIQRKLDEIIQFSGCERYIDTPVKRYSSGMYVRLAFAVAAHLEPDILVVDEVLAVGDASFQQKCIEKMKDIRAQGRAIVFVSHDLKTVSRLCSRCVFMVNGKNAFEGDVHQCIALYTKNEGQFPSKKHWDMVTAPQSAKAIFRSIGIINFDGEEISTAEISEIVGVEMCFDVKESGHKIVPCVSLTDESGELICLVNDYCSPLSRKELRMGSYRYRVWIPGDLLSEGVIYIAAALGIHLPTVAVEVHTGDKVIGFRIVDSASGNGARGDYPGSLPGIIRPKWDWERRDGK